MSEDIPEYSVNPLDQDLEKHIALTEQLVKVLQDRAAGIKQKYIDLRQSEIERHETALADLKVQKRNESEEIASKLQKLGAKARTNTPKEKKSPTGKKAKPKDPEIREALSSWMAVGDQKSLPAIIKHLNITRGWFEKFVKANADFIKHNGDTVINSRYFRP